MYTHNLHHLLPRLQEVGVGGPRAHPGKCLIVFCFVFIFEEKRNTLLHSVLAGQVTHYRSPALSGCHLRVSPCLRQGQACNRAFRDIESLKSAPQWLGQQRSWGPQGAVCSWAVEALGSWRCLLCGSVTAGCTGASSEYSQVQPQTWAVASSHALAPGPSHRTMPGASQAQGPASRRWCL